MAFRSAWNKEPALMIAGAIALTAVLLPLAVVPLRRAAGLPTYQWDCDPKTHPFLNDYGENYKVHDFTDATRVSEWARHSEYRYRTPLVSTARDFPEARERLKTKPW